MKKYTRITVQINFLFLFVTLLLLQRVQLWAALFFVSFAVTIFLGRFYCGWLCPINTAIKGVVSLKKRLNLKSLKMPSWLLHPWVRNGVLIAFIATFVLTLITGKKLPVLPMVFALGVLTTVFYPEKLWHRYLCPYGAILRFPAALSKRGYKINTTSCNNCSLCTKKCPADAIEKRDGQHQVLVSECLDCGQCANVCHRSAVHMRFGE